MPFKSVINEYYARDISRKIRSAKRNQALKGSFVGSHPPYGYIKHPDNHHKLIIDEESAATVRRMFEMADNGMGTHQIAQIISNEKILIPAIYKTNLLGYKPNHFDENFPFDWRTSTVRRILESRVYAGDMVSHKQGNKSFKIQKIVKRPESEWIAVEGTHEPLVSKDLFDRVQKMIKIKKRTNSSGVENIFAGVLKCSDCGCNMNFRNYAYSTPEQIRGAYLCNRYRHNGKSEVERKNCTAHYTPYVNLYAVTLARLNMLIAANLSEEDILTRLSSDDEPRKAEQKLLDKLTKRSDELDRIIRKIVEQNALGDISPETFTKLYGGYITEQNELDARMKAYEVKAASESDERENAQRFVETLRRYTASDNLSREKILDLIDSIVIYEPSGSQKHGTRQQGIAIHYRFIGSL
jgi:predicted transcriptional regulator